MPLLSTIGKELVNLKKAEMNARSGVNYDGSSKLINGFVNNFDTINKLAHKFGNRPIQPLDQLRKPYQSMANFQIHTK